MQFCTYHIRRVLRKGGAWKMYAVIETGGKQYRVQEGDVISVEKLGLIETDGQCLVGAASPPFD